jgi:Ankyrin repeats (3 copies)
VNFDDAARALLNGDCSFMEPQFARGADGTVPVIQWHAAGMFASHPDVLAEAFTCACFLSADEVVDYLLARGAHPDGGRRTGMTALHWAGNRGHAVTVDKLIRAGASLEERNRFGGTVLSCVVWSALNEPRPGQIEIIASLLNAGADVKELPVATGDTRIDELLNKYRH